MMLALDARSTNESIREGLKRLRNSQSRKVSNRPVPDLGTYYVRFGHKPIFAAQKGMSALSQIATAKADIRKRPCLLCP
jgi:hypothetical protein